MAKKKKRPEYSVDPTPMSVVVACFGGICGLYAAELLYDASQSSGPTNIPWLPSWRAHMACICVGTIAFVVSLYFLEELARKSRILAWRSSSAWLPLIALTGLAAAIHVSLYVVIPIGALYSLWAYRRTRSVH